MDLNRRKFIRNVCFSTAALGLAPTLLNSCNKNSGMFFEISLAQWSLHRALNKGEIDHLDFPYKAKNDFGIFAVEYVSPFFKDTSSEHLAELRNRTNSEGVENVLIMVDAEGNLGDLDEETRKKSVENHYKWVEAAKFLGCHSIRVNARGRGTEEEVAAAAVDGLSRLSEYASKEDIGVIVENHGGYSSNGKWLASVISQVNLPNCGTLPDFGNFRISNEESYDPYLGVKELMPFAKGVSAKSYEFDELGNETKIDYYKMLRIVKDSGYRGYIGIEYEGQVLSESEGIKATKLLLESAGPEIE